MKILIVGGGGREHSLAEALRRSKRVDRIFCAPGNGGTESIANNVPLNDLEKILDFAVEESIDLTIVGPEAPLVAGIADRFAAEGKAVFGPSRDGARLEGSKAWAKGFMKRHSIPTAPYLIAEEAPEALRLVESMWKKEGLVLKADGLAAGKGVVVASSLKEARDSIPALLAVPGQKILIEEKLSGSEVSLMAILDRPRIRKVLLLPVVRDHKALLEGNRGPNTGGMGAFFPDLEAETISLIEEKILGPLLKGLEEENISYRGALFLGLMLTPDGPKVLEFNCRLGDPETQLLLSALQSDFLDTLLDLAPPVFSPKTHICVVAASRGYPGDYQNNLLIEGLEEAQGLEGVKIFHAGTRRLEDGRFVTDGGRVLNLVAEGEDLSEARERAYRAMKVLRFGGEVPVFRTDIGLPCV